MTYLDEQGRPEPHGHGGAAGCLDDSADGPQDDGQVGARDVRADPAVALGIIEQGSDQAPYLLHRVVLRTGVPESRQAAAVGGLIGAGCSADVRTAVGQEKG